MIGRVRMPVSGFSQLTVSPSADDSSASRVAALAISQSASVKYRTGALLSQRSSGLDWVFAANAMQNVAARM